MTTENRYSIIPSPISWEDPHGTLLSRTDPDWVYRALTPRGKSILEHIQKHLGMEKLQCLGLVPTEVEAERIEDSSYQAILRHKKIQPLVYPTEWTMGMWKDALTMFCNLNLGIMKHGLMLSDAHPYNIVFDYGEPKFVDFGSLKIQSPGGYWYKWHKELKTCFLSSIFLNNLGLVSFAEASIKESLYSESFSTLSRFTPIPVLMSIFDFLYVAAKLSKNSEIYFKVIKFLATSSLSSSKKNKFISFDSSQQNWKENVVQAALKICADAPTVLVINSSADSLEIAKSGRITTLIDTKEDSLEKARNKAIQEKLPLAIAKLDFRFPTPPTGLGLFTKSSYERLRSELVIALETDNYLNCQENLKMTSSLAIHSFVSILNGYCGKYILTEFVELRKNCFTAKAKNDYSLNRFLNCFEDSHYKVIKKWMNPEQTHITFLFQRC